MKNLELKKVGVCESEKYPAYSPYFWKDTLFQRKNGSFLMLCERGSKIALENNENCCFFVQLSKKEAKEWVCCRWWDYTWPTCFHYPNG